MWNGELMNLILGLCMARYIFGKCIFFRLNPFSINCFLSVVIFMIDNERWLAIEFAKISLNTSLSSLLHDNIWESVMYFDNQTMLYLGHEKLIFCFSGFAAFVFRPPLQFFFIQEWCPYLCQIYLACDTADSFFNSSAYLLQVWLNSE